MPHFIETISNEQGLSSNNINDLVQDNNGFLWIATSDGLNRFDGSETVQYYHSVTASTLPHSTVYCLKKLPGDIIAAGTQNGLAFLNTQTGVIANFYDKQNKAIDKYNNIFFELETDISGNLWAASQNNIYVFNKHLELIKIIPSTLSLANIEQDKMKFSHKIYPLSNGDMLFRLFNGWYIYSFEKNSFASFQQSAFLQQLKFLENISPPHIDKSFVASHLYKIFKKYFLCIPAKTDSLFIFNEQGKKISSCYFANNHYPFIWWSQNINVIDSSKLLLLYHNQGFSFLALSWKNNLPEIQSVSPVLFSKQYFKTAIGDNQKNIWLATYHTGLKKICAYKQYFNGGELITNKGESSTSEIVSLNKFNHKLWVATYGDGFFEIDSATGMQQQHLMKNTGNDTWANYIWNIRYQNKDTIWVGSQAGMFWYKLSAKKYGRLTGYKGKPTALDSVAITIQYTDSHNKVWIGLGKGEGVCYYDNNKKVFKHYPGNSLQGYPLRYPTSIAEDSKGDLWFVSDASPYLVHWNRNNEKFEVIKLPVSPGIIIGNLNGICCDDDSIIWLGSVNCGLLKYDLVKNQIKIYGHENGLSNNYFTSIYMDDKKRLWLITGAALSCFSPATVQFKNFTEKDGLPVQYPINYFFYDNTASLLYGGGIGKYFYFNPDSVDFNFSPQKTIITAIQINGKLYHANSSLPLQLRHNQNNINIRFTSIDFLNGSDTKYAYRLMDNDTIWINLGNQRQINFSNLAPGSYNFMVKAGNSSGQWNAQADKISFIIKRPFTNTIWFLLSILTGSILIFYALYHFRLKQLKRTDMMRNEISKNLHDEVGSNLSNINLSVLLAQKHLHDKTVLKKLLQRIYEDSRTVSDSMREIVWNINPNTEHLGNVFPRMLHYASEILEAKNIDLQATISPLAEGLKLNMKERYDVYLIFKEAINNIARHSEAKHVQIQFNSLHSNLQIIIIDDGKGFDYDTVFINSGLKNMQERAKSHNWEIKIQSMPDAGTTILLHTK